MIDIDESQELMEKFIALRSKAEESKFPQDINEFKKHEAVCINKFMYLVTMKTAKYKNFNNYDDLVQEGLEALVKSMKNYSPKKGNFFWWAHHYIRTRISRSANLHTTIRYPLRVAKANAPHKESVMPVQIEERFCPDKQLEKSQLELAIQQSFSTLTENQAQVVSLAFGFDGGKPMSVNKICNKLGLTRLGCLKAIRSALSTMKSNIKV